MIMKKIVYTFMLALLPMVASAVDFTLNGLGYTIIPASDYYSSHSFENEAELTDGTLFSETSLIVPSTVEHGGVMYHVVRIGSSAFAGNRNIEMAELPDDIEKICSGAFEGCSSLKSIRLPQNLIDIEQAAFKNCRSLEETILPDSLTSTGHEAFSGCSSIKSLVFPQRMYSLGTIELFANCSSLEEIILPRYVHSVKGVIRGNPSHSGTGEFTRSFINCPNLKKVALCSNYDRYDQFNRLWLGNSFEGCSALAEIILTGEEVPNTAILFSEEQYKNTTIVVPDEAVEAYRKHEAWSKFANIITAGEYMKYGDNGPCGIGVSYSFVKDTHTLTITGKGMIDNYSLDRYCTPWTSYRDLIHQVEIGNEITSIGDAAFKGCYNMTSISTPSSMQAFGQATFEGCSSLLYVDIPNGQTTLDNFLFKDCSSLSTITIPESVSLIGLYVFTGCYGLTSITCLNPEPPSLMGEESLDLDYIDYTTITLYVPKGSVNKYRAEKYWRNFLHIEEAETAIQQPKTLVTSTDAPVYNLQGQRLTDKPRKGIYIQNGKKVVIK
jgi:hypothetical protein